MHHGDDKKKTKKGAASHMIVPNTIVTTIREISAKPDTSKYTSSSIPQTRNKKGGLKSRQFFFYDESHSQQ